MKPQPWVQTTAADGGLQYALPAALLAMLQIDGFPVIVGLPEAAQPH